MNKLILTTCTLLAFIGVLQGSDHFARREFDLFTLRIGHVSASGVNAVPDLTSGLGAVEAMMTSLLESPMRRDKDIYKIAFLFKNKPSSQDVASIRGGHVDRFFSDLAIELSTIVPHVNLMDFPGIVSESIREPIRLMMIRGNNAALQTEFLLRHVRAYVAAPAGRRADIFSRVMASDGGLSARLQIFASEARQISERLVSSGLVEAIVKEASEISDNPSRNHSLVVLNEWLMRFISDARRDSDIGDTYGIIKHVLTSGFVFSKSFDVILFEKYPHLLKAVGFSEISAKIISRIVSTFASLSDESEWRSLFTSYEGEGSTDFSVALLNAPVSMLEEAYDFISRYATLMRQHFLSGLPVDNAGAGLISPAQFLRLLLTQPDSLYPYWARAVIDFKIEKRLKRNFRMNIERMVRAGLEQRSKDFDQLYIDFSEFYQNRWNGEKPGYDFFKLPQDLFLSSLRGPFHHEDVKREGLVQLGRAWLQVHEAIASTVSTKPLNAELRRALPICGNALHRLVSTDTMQLQDGSAFVSELKSLAHAMRTNAEDFQLPSLCRYEQEYLNHFI